MSNEAWVIVGVVFSCSVVIMLSIKGLIVELARINNTLILLLESQKYSLDLHIQSGYVFVDHDKRLKVLEKVDLSNCKFEGE